MSVDFSLSNTLLLEEAKRRGWLSEILSRESNLIRITPTDKKPVIFNMALCKLNSGIGFALASDKHMTRVICEKYDLPYPASEVYNPTTSIEFLKKHKVVVIKPQDTEQGIGITTGINDLEKLIKAYKNAQKFTKERVLIQRHHEGEDHRFLVIGGEVIAVGLRRPPCAIGDGVSTVDELLAKLNEHEWRGTAYNTPLTIINRDSVAQHLSSKGMSLKDIPANNEKIILLGVSNTMQGGEAVDVTKSAHPELKAMAVRLAEIMDLKVAGVDILTKDVTAPISEGNSVILEINKIPGLRMHHYPVEGDPINAAGAILDLLE